MIGRMETDDVTIECATCPATGTTACGDCVIAHLLANDAGPIDFTTTAPVPLGTRPGSSGVAPTAVERAVDLLAAAGLLDDPPVLVPPIEFERAGLAERTHSSA
jgi:hypothetical protein